MAALRPCISSVLSLHPTDTARIDDLFQTYRDSGMHPDEAAKAAVEDAMHTLDGERGKFFDALREQHPNLFEKPEAPAMGSQLLSAIKKAGGIDPTHAVDLTGDNAAAAGRRMPGVFKKGGMSSDKLLEFMQNHQWLGEDASIRDAQSMLRDAFDRRDITPHDSTSIEDMAAAREREAYDAHLQRMNEDPEYRAEQERLERGDMEAEGVDATPEAEYDHSKIAEAYSLDAKATEAASEKYDNNPSAFMREVERIINENSGAKEAGGGKENSRAGEGSAKASDFTLEQHDAADLEGRQQREDAAATAERDRQLELERKAKADAERNDFGLTGSDRTADANPNQHDLLDGMGPGTLSANPFANPAQLKALARNIRNLFLGTDAQTKDNWHVLAKAVTGVRENVVRSGGIVNRFFNAAFNTSTGSIRNFTERFNSKTAQEVIDHFATEAGSDRVTGETFQQSVLGWTNKQYKRLHEALGDLQSNDQAMRQIANRVRAENFDNTRLGKAAKEVSEILKESLDYMRNAGVEVGEVKKGYYPREFNLPEIIKDYGSGKFIDALTAEYQGMGMSKADASAAAHALRDTLVNGDSSSMFSRNGGAVRTPFTKERTFGSHVDQAGHPLNRFLMSDPAENITTYLSRASRRAEIARRFGDRFSHWGSEWVDANGKKQQSISSKIEAEGGQEAIRPLMDYVALQAGLRSAGVGDGALRMASIARTWGSLAFLEKATLSSLSEFITPAIRAAGGSSGMKPTFLLDVTRSLHHTIADLVAKSSSASAAERRAFAEDLGLIVSHLSDQISAARFSGGEPASKLESHILANYFRRTFLTQWTEATRVASVDIGRTFIRRLAKQVADGDRLSIRHLKELGVPESEAKAFSDAVIKANDGMPTVADLAAMGKHGQIYRSSIGRFLEQSIMEPNKGTKPGWMSHPFGAVVGQLQSFNYAFFENVLKRNARLAAEGIKGKDSAGNSWDMGERARLLAPLLSLPALIGAAYAVGEVRDQLLGDPNKRATEGPGQKLIKAVSRGMPIAPIDPLVNYLTSAKYQRSSIDFASGPVLGTLGRGVDAARNVMINNNPNTNTAERQAARALWDVLIEPGVNLALSALPSSGLAQKAATQAAGSGDVREQFITAVAGKDKTLKKQRKNESW